MTDKVNSTPDDLTADEEYNDLEMFLLSNPHIPMWQIIPPVIIVLGTFGNVMTIVIMRRMSEGQSSHTMSLYFTALAVSDLVLLYAGLINDWLNVSYKINVYLFNVFFCKLIPFLVYCSGTTSAWLIVSMTMQKVMSVVWPHYKSLSCTKGKVRLVIFTTVAVPIALNAHRVIYNQLVTNPNSTDKMCYMTNYEVRHFTILVYPWIDLALSSIIPFSILIVGNSVLVWKVIQSVHVARVMTAGGCDQVNSRQKKASSLTLTLITVSMVFLITSMPGCIYFIVRPYVNIDNRISMATIVFVVTVCMLAWYTNSAINFYLYCLTGSRFRKELKSFSCGRCPELKLSKVTFLTSDTGHSSKFSIKNNHGISDF